MSTTRRFSVTLLTLVLLLSAVSEITTAKTKITFAMRLQGGQAALEDGRRFIDTILAEFERQNPDLEVEFFPLSGDWINKMTTEMIAGTAPDMFEMWGDFSVNWAEKGMLLDLAPLVQKDFSADYIKGFYPGQWNATILLTGPNAGIRYGIPRYTNSTILFYNQDLFDQAGLPNPHQLETAGNWTWATLLQSAKKLVKRDADRVQVWGYHELRGWQWVWSNGGKVFDYPANPTKFVLDEPAAVGGLSFLASFVSEHGIMSPNRGAVAFSRGEAAMSTHYGSATIRGIGAEVGDQFGWDIAPIPVAPQGGRISAIFLDMWGIYSQSKHPEASWRLVKFMLSPYTQGMNARMFGEQPSHASGVPQYLQAFKDVNIRYAVDMAVSANIWPSSVLPKAAEVYPLVNRVLEQAVFQNQKPLEVVLAEVRPAIEGIYAKD